ncbi:hypothetical protein J7K52_06080 [Candidatus Bathyarchaeota archaeon]|nr:hypothetical protein [Candidatus Bathyarchaeota archaeon]
MVGRDQVIGGIIFVVYLVLAILYTVRFVLLWKTAWTLDDRVLAGRNSSFHRFHGYRNMDRMDDCYNAAANTDRRNRERRGSYKRK